MKSVAFAIERAGLPHDAEAGGREHRTWIEHLELLEEAVIAYRGPLEEACLQNEESIAEALCISEAVVVEWWESLPEDPWEIPPSSMRYG